jgi:hypothetical protein
MARAFDPHKQQEDERLKEEEKKKVGGKYPWAHLSGILL